MYFSEYDIGGRIGYLILDNASTNDAAVDLIRKTYLFKNAGKAAKATSITVPWPCR